MVLYVQAMDRKLRAIEAVAQFTKSFQLDPTFCEVMLSRKLGSLKTDWKKIENHSQMRHNE